MRPLKRTLLAPAWAALASVPAARALPALARRVNRSATRAGLFSVNENVVPTRRFPRTRHFDEDCLTPVIESDCGTSTCVGATTLYVTVRVPCSPSASIASTVNVWLPREPVSSAAPFATEPVQVGATHEYEAVTAWPWTKLAASAGEAIVIAGSGPNAYTTPWPALLPTVFSGALAKATLPVMATASPSTSGVLPSVG